MKNDTKHKTIVFALEEVLRTYRLCEDSELEKTALRAIVSVCQELVDRSNGPGTAEPNERNISIFFDLYDEALYRINKQEKISYHEFQRNGKEIESRNVSHFRDLGRRLRESQGVFKNVLNW